MYNPTPIIRGALGHELSYSLTRPYPRGRWYSSKLVVSTIFLILLVLFATFNLANTGYGLQPRYTTNPNDTKEELHWFNHKLFTFGDTKLSPDCQPIDIPIGFQFMTTNLGLHYTVTEIRHKVSGMEVHPSQVSYTNNTLQNCEVDKIDTRLQKADRSPPGGYFWSWQTSAPSVWASCDVENEEGVFRIFFKTGSIDLSSYSYVADYNHTTHASTWWGTRILNNYFFGLRVVMAGNLPDSGKQSLDLTLVDFSFSPGSTKDMRSQNLFNPHWAYLTASGGTDNGYASRLGRNPTMLYNNATVPFWRPITEAFFFAKVMRSLVLVDLGDNKTSNLLLDEDLLQYALSADDDFNRKDNAPLGTNADKDHAPWKSVHGIPSPDTKTGKWANMTDAYAQFRHMTGRLETKKASIYTQYTCSVPQAKGVATALLFTLVTTLALLQTSWMIFKWLTELAMAHDPMVMYCSGCLSRGLELTFSSDATGHEHSYRGSRSGGESMVSASALLQQKNRSESSDEER
ncbi:hypothetical protein BT63DRAFT_418197 [Microthyrium microscopicum]|uniref:Transmembrane protein n=1 Tax=Microthyrium microscopicum TaxID=703497 RepID=A0A6A6TYX0_9PEZI|nr:hypothetical protein BT63DRAFT_418197 [Microthyrium microscopicum]